MTVNTQRKLQREDWSALGKHPELIVHDSDPANAEPPLRLLAREFITPGELFYVRNHGTVPEVNTGELRLVVDGLVTRELTLSLQELRERFPRRTVTAALHCAGNRRLELMAVKEIPDEVPWREGVIGSAQWTGVALRDVLQAAGLEEDAAHVAFIGLDEIEEDGERFAFGGSIPLAKALSDEVLLADEMNGAPLPLLPGRAGCTASMSPPTAGAAGARRNCLSPTSRGRGGCGAPSSTSGPASTSSSSVRSSPRRTSSPSRRTRCGTSRATSTTPGTEFG